MNYIIFQNLNGKKIPILFPESESHQQVVDLFKRATVLVPTSAGKVSCDYETIFTHGVAHDIGLKPTPFDDELIVNAMKQTNLK